MLNDFLEVKSGRVERACRPGVYRIYRSGGAVVIEVFRNASE